MRKIFNFKKTDILTIPNILSFFRIALVPLIAWCYLKGQYIESMILLIVSALTDVIDGIIARKCNMISDFGKIIDPFADKLTQFAMIVCLTNRYREMFFLIGFFLLKEISQAILGLLVVKKHNIVNSAQWFGKASTVVLYAVIIALVIFPWMNRDLVTGLIFFATGMLAISFISYSFYYIRILMGKDEQSVTPVDEVSNDPEKLKM